MYSPCVIVDYKLKNYNPWCPSPLRGTGDGLLSKHERWCNAKLCDLPHYAIDVALTFHQCLLDDFQLFVTRTRNSNYVSRMSQ